MIYPKTIRTYCPYCRKHTEHTVKIVKASRKRGTLTEGQRRFERKLEGYGGSPKPTQAKRSGGYKGRYGSKTTKKAQILLICKECGKGHNRKGFRIRKLEVKKK